MGFFDNFSILGKDKSYMWEQDMVSTVCV